MTAIRIPDLLQELLTATADEVNAKARVSIVRSTLEDEGRRRLADEGAAPTWKTGLGVVRYDAQGDWRAVVAVPSAFGSYVAEHHPENATATVVLNSADLEAVLEAIEFAGIRPLSSAVEVREPFGTEFLKGLTVDVAESQASPGHPVGDERTFTVTEVDKTTGEARPVPGLSAARTPAKLVVTLDKDQRQAAIEAATAAAEQVVANATVLDAEQTEAADPEPVRELATRLNTAHADVGKKLATALGLSTTGTKADLSRRVALAAFAQESHMAAVLAVLKAAELNPKPDPNVIDPAPLSSVINDEDYVGPTYDVNPFDEAAVLGTPLATPEEVAAPTESDRPIEPANIGAEALERARIAALELDETRRRYENLGPQLDAAQGPPPANMVAGVGALGLDGTTSDVSQESESESPAPPAVTEPPETVTPADDESDPEGPTVTMDAPIYLQEVNRETLRKFAKARNVAPGGSKPDLIDRLVADGVSRETFAAWQATNR